MNWESEIQGNFIESLRPRIYISGICEKKEGGSTEKNEIDIIGEDKDNNSGF